jgi:hypothetical protein
MLLEFVQIFSETTKQQITHLQRLIKDKQRRFIRKCTLQDWNLAKSEGIQGGKMIDWIRHSQAHQVAVSPLLEPFSANTRQYEITRREKDKKRPNTEEERRKQTSLSTELIHRTTSSLADGRSAETLPMSNCRRPWYSSGACFGQMAVKRIQRKPPANDQHQ